MQIYFEKGAFTFAFTLFQKNYNFMPFFVIFIVPANRKRGNRIVAAAVSFLL